MVFPEQDRLSDKLVNPSLPVIPRPMETKEIQESLADHYPSNPLYFLLGPQGSGKSTFLRGLFDYYAQCPDWLFVDLSGASHLLLTASSAIIDQGRTKGLLSPSETNFFWAGEGFVLEGQEPISSPFALLTNLLNILKEKRKKVLFIIDDVVNSTELQHFLSDYQSFLRRKHLVYLLMAGTFENISKLQDEESITFLYRVPKIYLGPLPLKEIAFNYMCHLDISLEEAASLAKFTQGYAYAYLVLGLILGRNKKKTTDNEVLIEFDRTLAENAYNKIYSELTKTERRIVKSFDNDESVPTTDMIAKLGINEKSFRVFCDRLIKKRVVISDGYGLLRLALPRFREYLFFR